MIQEIFIIQNPWREDVKYSFDLLQREISSVLWENMSNEVKSKKTKIISNDRVIVSRHQIQSCYD